MSREKPAPELVEEAQRFVARIGTAISGGEDEEGREFRFTLTVPEEHALMAAWVMFKEAMRQDGVPVVLPRPVQLHLDDGRRSRDWDRARSYFMRAIFERFDADYTALLLGEHPALFPEPVFPALPVADDLVMDDDIPF